MFFHDIEFRFPIYSFCGRLELCGLFLSLDVSMSFFSVVFFRTVEVVYMLLLIFFRQEESDQMSDGRRMKNDAMRNTTNIISNQ